MDMCWFRKNDQFFYSRRESQRHSWHGLFLKPQGIEIRNVHENHDEEGKTLAFQGGKSLVEDGSKRRPMSDNR